MALLLAPSTTTTTTTTRTTRQVTRRQPGKPFNLRYLPRVSVAVIHFRVCNTIVAADNNTNNNNNRIVVRKPRHQSRHRRKNQYRHHHPCVKLISVSGSNNIDNSSSSKRKTTTSVMAQTKEIRILAPGQIFPFAPLCFRHLNVHQPHQDLSRDVLGNNHINIKKKSNNDDYSTHRPEEWKPSIQQTMEDQIFEKELTFPHSPSGLDSSSNSSIPFPSITFSKEVEVNKDVENNTNYKTSLTPHHQSRRERRQRNRAQTSGDFAYLLSRIPTEEFQALSLS